MKEEIRNDEIKVKEDKYGNLIVTFVKDVLMERGSHLYIYCPFTKPSDSKLKVKEDKNE